MTKNTTKQDAFDRVQAHVLDLMEKGVAPWQKTWEGSGVHTPASISTGKAYKGLNSLMLHWAGFDNRWFGTYKILKKNGGQVRKGEKGSTATFWKWLDIKDKNTGQKKKIPFYRYYTVFNVTQCDWEDGMPEKWLPVTSEDQEGFEPLEEAQAILDGYLQGFEPPSYHLNGNDKAYYMPFDDSVHMPDPKSFQSPSKYYATSFHELGHSTGHPKRLRRFATENLDKHGSHAYSFEELVAEFTACFLCEASGIVDTRENSAAYLNSWKKAIKGDRKMVVQAAGKAQKAAAMILNGGEKVVYEEKKKEEKTAPAA